MRANPENCLDTLLIKLERSSEDESKQLIVGFLKLCQRTLIGAPLNKQIDIFMQVAYLLAYRPGDLIIWSWLKEMSKGADESRREAMRIAIFELVPEDPICEANLSLLWSFVDDPSTSWAVEQAYLHHPKLRRNHFEQYGRHRKP